MKATTKKRKKDITIHDKQFLLRREQMKEDKHIKRSCHDKYSPEPKTGYIHVYKANITSKDVEFARLHQVKLVTTLSVYSSNTDTHKINSYLKNKREDWTYENELQYIDYEFVKCEPINHKLTELRSSCFWDIEKNAEQLTVGEEKVEVYNCYTTANYLKSINRHHGIIAWVFSRHSRWSMDPVEKYYRLTDISHYNRLINKGKLVVVSDPVLAAQCLKLRAKLGHEVKYIRDKYFIPKYVTKHHAGYRKRKEYVGRVSFDNDPEQQRMVCVTDGTTVTRIKKYKAEKLIEQFPTMKYCEKHVYNHYLAELRGEKVPKMSTINPKGNRRQRGLIKQKRKLYSRQYTSQFIEIWELDESGNFETYKGTRRVLHRTKVHSKFRRKRHFHSEQPINPDKRKRKPSMFKKTEKEVMGIEISKFPYNQPMTVCYTETDKDGTVQHHKVENVKMRGKQIVQEDPKNKAERVICPVKNIEEWVEQSKYYEKENYKIPWHKFVTIVPIKRTKVEKINFHLPQKTKKTKHWKNPSKEPNYIGKIRRANAFIALVKKAV